jgi:hypothetical protein
MLGRTKFLLVEFSDISYPKKGLAGKPADNVAGNTAGSIRRWANG